MNRRLLVICVLLIVLSISVTVDAHERNDGGYFTIVDESNNPVYYTGWNVRVGDQFLTAENKRYEVYSVEGDIARARLIGEVNMSLYAPKTNNFAFFDGILRPRIAHAQGGKVAIYHTHSDESYVPTDGAESILGAGGVYKVGDAFTESLKSKGMEVIHSDAKHDPHDDMAYERSRRTAMNIVKQQQPDAIFDVHRDAVPPQVYSAKMEGQDISKVQLVVGKYGPTGKQIEDYAMQIKSASDSKHPGLIRGIFFAKGGDYNQDLHPRSMLLEVGAHTNTRESAEKGVALFADVVPTVLGKTSAAPANQEGTAGVGTQATGPSGSTKSIGWIIGLVVVGAAAFLFLSTGSLKEAGAKLKQFGSSEFANFFGPKLKKKDKRKSDNREDNDDRS